MTPSFVDSSGNDLEQRLAPLTSSLLVKGPLWMWGSNYKGQLGNSFATGDLSSPVMTVPGLVPWQSVDFGGYHAGGVKSDGSLWLWGTNSYMTNSGQLGDNTLVDKSSPVQTVAAGTNWKQVSCSFHHTAAIKTDGTLWSWGNNAYGQLGSNTTTKRSSPAQTVAGGSWWKQVSCGGFRSNTSEGYTAAIKTDGTLWLWGNNTVGQLGDGALGTHRSSPVQTVSGGTNWKQVSCGSFHTAAIKTDGTLWLWGLNSSGQLGDGTRLTQQSPVQSLAGGANWKQVFCGYAFTAAIKTDGTLWMWGNNAYGQLGDGTTVSKSSPIQLSSGGSTWTTLASGHGSNHLLAMKLDGTVWVWGSGTNGKLGNGSAVNLSSPVQLGAGFTYTRLFAGLSNSGAV